MKNKSCFRCKARMKELRDKTPEGVEFRYFKCDKCGEEILDMGQLHNVAQKYREMKRFHAKVSKWGMSLGLRIPNELAKRYHLKDDRKVAIIPEDEGMKIIPV